MTALKSEGVRVYVADLDASAVEPENVATDAPVCLWFGAESEGVSAEARARADGVVCVPMLGFAQSLNVSVAAALALRPVCQNARHRGQDALLSAPERGRILEGWLQREEQHRRAIELSVGLGS